MKFEIAFHNMWKQGCMVGLFGVALGLMKDPAIFMEAWLLGFSVHAQLKWGGNQ